MANRILITLGALVTFIVATNLMAAGIQPNFSYQGQLLNDDGTPANGIFDIHLAIYEVSEGGIPLWEETQTGVQVDNGLFTVIVGGTDPLTPDILSNSNDEGDFVTRYLEIQVGANPPMSPRTQLLAAPYSGVSGRMAGDIFTSPGSIRMGVEPVPFQPLMTMNVWEDSASIRMGVEPDPFMPTVEINTNLNTTTYRMGVEPEPFQPAVEINAGQNTTTFSMGIEPEPFDPAPEMEMLMDENSTTFRMGVDPTPFQPAVEINANLNTSSFRMGVEPQPFHPAVEMNAGQNTTTFSLGIEPQPFDPAPEIAMTMDQNSTTFSMGVDPQPFNPSVELQALSDLTSFALFNPSATNDDKTVSQMTADMGGHFNWNLSLPDTGPPRPVMNMSTGDNGEMSMTFFNPQPEIPGIGILGMNTSPNGADFSMTSPQYGGLRTDIVPPMIKLATLGELSTFQMFDPTAGTGGGVISEMNANVGGTFSWLMFNPQPEPPGRPIMDMSTGPGGELSWRMFNPQPEPPGEPWMDFGTDADGPHFQMTGPMAGGGRLDITEPMLDLNADSSGSEIALQRNFIDRTGISDSTRMYLSVDSERSMFEMSGPNSSGGPAVKMVNYPAGPMVGIGVEPTSILTVRQSSATDPIADAWTVYSSRRWKKNIKTLDNALEKIERLRGVTFDWRADGRHDVGLIAEEVGEVIPEVVAYEKNGVDAKSVDYARLVSVLIEAVKEQQETIESLQNKLKENNQLRAEVDELKEIVRQLAPEPNNNNSGIEVKKTAD